LQQAQSQFHFYFLAQSFQEKQKMGLINLAQRSTQVLARETSDTRIATTAQGLSLGAINALGKGDIANSQKLASTIPVLRKTPTQTQAFKLADNLGAVIRDAKQLKFIEPVVIEAAKSYEQAAVSRAKMAAAVGGAAQRVGVINASTQAGSYPEDAAFTGLGCV